MENTNKIMNLCEEISPVRPDKCPPVIENSDEMLRKICHDRAHEIYGPKLPQIVTERLDRELNSIISNGYSVMYIIAQKLVWKSNDDGYLVGSRGSVGSSFAATMTLRNLRAVRGVTCLIKSVQTADISLINSDLTFRLKHSLDLREIKSRIST